LLVANPRAGARTGLWSWPVHERRSGGLPQARGCGGGGRDAAGGRHIWIGTRHSESRQYRDHQGAIAGARDRRRRRRHGVGCGPSPWNWAPTAC
jgi:hypothetical protein